MTLTVDDLLQHSFVLNFSGVPNGLSVKVKLNTISDTYLRNMEKFVFNSYIYVPLYILYIYIHLHIHIPICIHIICIYIIYIYI